MSNKKNDRPGLNIVPPAIPKSMDEVFGVSDSQGSSMYPIDKFVAFKNHPFRVIEDDEMKELIQSVGQLGVLEPIQVRPTDNDKFEIISGHRRLYAAKANGLSEIPATVKELEDDEAIIIMVDSNLKREVRPSEKAFSLKMRLDAMNRRGQRTDLKGENGSKKTSSDELAEATGEKKSKIFRLIRLTYLIPELLDLVDNKRLPFISAVEISYIGKIGQRLIFDQMTFHDTMPNTQKAKDLRRLDENKKLSKDSIDKVLIGEKKEPTAKITIPVSDIYMYFPPHTSPEEMKDKILQLLEQHTS